MQLRGKFLLNGVASKAIIYLEGPPPGVDILVDGLVLKRVKKALPSNPPNIEVHELLLIFVMTRNITVFYPFESDLYRDN